MVLDEFGNVTIDTIEIPSACLCHAKSGTFGFNLRRSLFLPLTLKCKIEDASKSLSHETFNDDNFEEDEDINEIQDELLANAAASVRPCSNNRLDTICSDNDPNYPKLEIQALLQKHGLFSNKEYFERLFGKPCIFGPKNEDFVLLRGGLNFEETEVCSSIQKFAYPKKGKTVYGKWKYIVNTDGYQQGISIHKCINQSVGKSCKYAGAPGHFPEATECKQMFKKHSFLSINSDGSIEFDDYQIPVACACHILDNSLFLEYK